VYKLETYLEYIPHLRTMYYIVHHQKIDIADVSIATSLNSVKLHKKLVEFISTYISFADESVQYLLHKLPNFHHLVINKLIEKSEDSHCAPIFIHFIFGLDGRSFHSFDAKKKKSSILYLLQG
jgi:hypothetical protein